MYNTFTLNSLVILLWNANGLKRVDIVLLSETHFTTNSYINLSGYHSLRENHPDNSTHAGTAIYILNPHLLISYNTYVQQKVKRQPVKLYETSIPRIYVLH